MSTAAIPGAPLPVRTPGSRARGRHRRPERPEVPVGAPALVLAVPAVATPAAVALVNELVSVIRGEQPGIEVAAGWLPTAPAAEQDPYQGEPTANADEGAEPNETNAHPRFWPTATVEGLIAGALEAGRPAPVLVPLLPGPHDYLTDLHSLAAETGALPTEALGPHPLLAEAVHVRLSEAGLARADRARLFAITTAADGVVLTTVGGQAAADAAGITGVLLAARLAVPVVAAALDVPGSVAAAVEHLRATGSQRPALAPLVIGPEVEEELLVAAAEETGCPSAAALGAYPTIGQLIASSYLAALPAPTAEEAAERAAAELAAAERALAEEADAGE
ncbi:hypothetical protein OG455_35025 [Kitasatospora sp. NBC_01287]|uniref:hypothetical protein n=1 Tax=Kitasatospora sp. NBC_01287 TaxID=2903573 RepID=UPI002251C85E|nr:hypothetical protein [Kitasatospora sp. NBC_01287]MCX4750661.1 hypothetical protein [Kitasatospora sp. NBC_01287]